MIFQSLIDFYDRLVESDQVPPYGFSNEDIGFVLNIDKNGNLVGQPEDLRTKIKTNTYNFRQSIVPYSNKVNVRAGKGAAETSNFIVDKADYVFGMSGKTKKTTHQQSFKALIETVSGDSSDEGVLAVKASLKEMEPGRFF